MRLFKYNIHYNFYYLVLFLLVSFSYTTPCFSQETRNISRSENEKNVVVTGNTYAIIVGISEYPFIKPLHYADKDAELFNNFLQTPAGGNVKQSNIKMLLNENATAANFWTKGFSWLKNKKPKKGDRVYFYFAGHADAIDKNDCFFLTYDCRPDGDKNNYYFTGAIQLANVKNQISNFSNTGVDVILIMDACRTNELPGGATGQKIFSESVIEKRNGETMMFAANSGQLSVEDHSIGNGHGLFTWYLVDGLAGNADTNPYSGNQNGKIDLYELESWVKRNVIKEARQKFNLDQEPYFCCSGVSKTITVTKSKRFNPSSNGIIKNINFEQNLSINNLLFSKKRNEEIVADGELVSIYNHFNHSIKGNRLSGDSTAEYWYIKMKEKYPTHSYTIDSRNTLTSELINFAQDKINLYLSGADYSFQKKDVNPGKKLLFEERLKAVAKTPFNEVADMLEKGIALSTEFDTTIEQKYLSRLYFLKARSVLAEDESSQEPRPGSKIDFKRGLQFAYKALSIDSNAAYIYHVLAKYIYLKNWIPLTYTVKDNHGNDSLVYIGTFNNVPLDIDSIAYYENKALDIAPNWAHAYYNLGSFYIGAFVVNDIIFSKKNYGILISKNLKSNSKLDTVKASMKKCLKINPAYRSAYISLAALSDWQSEPDSALYYMRKALLLDSVGIDWDDFVRYHFKVNPDSGIYYYKKFRLNLDRTDICNTLSNIIESAVDNNDINSSIFFFKEFLSDAFCDNPTIGYALTCCAINKC